MLRSKRVVLPSGHSCARRVKRMVLSPGHRRCRAENREARATTGAVDGSIFGGGPLCGLGKVRKVLYHYIYISYCVEYNGRPLFLSWCYGPCGLHSFSKADVLLLGPFYTTNKAGPSRNCLLHTTAICSGSYAVDRCLEGTNSKGDVFVLSVSSPRKLPMQRPNKRTVM